MNPAIYATEGWIWARAARRRLDDALAPAEDIFEETDRTADLGQSIEALDRGASGADHDFYQGKIAAASFFATNFLPLLTSTRAVLENLNNDIMEMPEAAF